MVATLPGNPHLARAGLARHRHQLPPARHPGPGPGDYDAAEPLYRRSLEINEQLGNQAATAASYTDLGGLSEAAGNLDEAAAYRVGVLSIRLQIGTVTAGDLQPLADLRCRLGHDRFRSAALASGLDEQSADSLIEMLDQQEETAGN